MISARLQADAGERRQSDRLPVAIEARVRPLGEESSEARILNLSETGFMAQTSTVYEVGSRLWLFLPGRARANAVVRWIAGDKLGAEFSEPIAVAGGAR
ncbi:MAG: PilZ domain-containing protein [Sphingomicrobium sp.]